MKSKRTINLKTYFNISKLLTRNFADSIFEELIDKGHNDFEISFLGIEFISRAFADQFYSNKIKIFKEKNIKIEVTNCNSSVYKMFLEVTRTNQREFKRVYKKSEFLILNIESIADIKKLDFIF